MLQFLQRKKQKHYYHIPAKPQVIQKKKILYKRLISYPVFNRIFFII